VISLTGGIKDMMILAEVETAATAASFNTPFKRTRRVIGATDCHPQPR